MGKRHGFLENPPEGAKQGSWIPVICHVCGKAGWKRVCEVKKHPITACSLSCSSLSRWEYAGARENAEEIKGFIFEHGIKETCKKYSISPYVARRITGWNGESAKAFLKRQAVKFAEQRELRRKERNRERSRKPEVRAQNSAKGKERRLKRPFVEAINRYGKGVTIRDYRRIAKKQKLRCAYSGVKLTRANISIDHIIPFAKGGTHTPDNIVLCDMWVNRMKLDKSVEEFKTMIATLCAHMGIK